MSFFDGGNTTLGSCFGPGIPIHSPDLRINTLVRTLKQRWLPIFLLLSMIAVVAGCSGTSNAVSSAAARDNQVVATVIVSPGSATITALGDTLQLTASVLNSKGNAISGAPVVWTSSNESVATVSASGLVTAVSLGGAGVTATADGVSATASLAVVQGVTDVAEVIVTPGSATITAFGDILQFSASVLNSSGIAISGATVVWTSSNESVATVSASGLVTAVGSGGAAVTATADGLSATASVAVVQEVAAVAVMPSLATLVSIGESTQLTAQATDGNGHPIAGVSFTWSSSDPGIVNVTGQGLATAVSNGVATVIAGADGIQDSASILVDQFPAQLRFSREPSTSIVDTILSPGPAVIVLDALGTIVRDANDTITVAIANNPAGGTLTGTTTVGATMGVAIFGNLAIDRAGASYSLSASAGVLTSATSNFFNVNPEPVTITVLTKTPNAITVEWSESLEPSFAAYYVLRSTNPVGGGIVLDTVTNPSTTLFEDSSAALGQIYYYSIVLVTTDGLTAFSNTESIEAGVSVTLGTAIEKMILDPTRTMLYAISRNTNTLFFIDTATNTVADSIFIGMEPTDLDIDATGDKLFVVSFSTNILFEVDLTTRTIVNSFNFPNPANHSQGLHYHIAAGRPGRVYLVDAGWAPAIHVLDTVAETELGIFNFQGVGDIEASADGNTLYVWRQYGWGAGNINSWITRIDASTDTITATQVGTTNIGRDPLDTPLILAVSDTLVHAKRWAFSAADLEIIDAVFPQNIYAVTPDGRLVLSEFGIYDGTTGLLIAAMPLASRLLAITPDSSTLFIHKPGAGRIFVYDLSSF